MSRSRAFIATLLAAASITFAGATAQTIEDNYKGKQLRFVVAAAPGGGADLYARALQKHFSKHVPGNPTLVVQNVPGAGGLTAASQIMNNPAKDGLVFALLQRNNLVEPLLSERQAGFDPRKVKWLGSLNKDTYVIISWHTTGVKTLADVQKTELLLGNTGGGNENSTLPELLNRTLGTKFKLVRGYPGSHEVGLAIERGEVQGRAVTWTTLRAEHSDWIQQGKIHMVTQIGMSKNPEIGNVQAAIDLVTNPDDRSLMEFMFSPLEAGRPFAMPPDTPEPILAAMRKAFVDLANDPEFVAELKARGGSVELLNGQDTQALVDRLYQTSGPVLNKARDLMKSIQK